MHVGPAGGVGVEVVLGHTGRVVGGGEHVAGAHMGREVVARLIVGVKVVLVERLPIRETFKRRN